MNNHLRKFKGVIMKHHETSTLHKRPMANSEGQLFRSIESSGRQCSMASQRGDNDPS